ncbi:hypothetical protein IEO21_00315 [Rhodonia placenta]|uniref:Uncharacterized protein n=1 Tax=Rhodonia placenta TaxID=104341 RepID=A0A8H7PBS2_9APHY|nr:hypothetical protein IEO21_00315 [Postia placenta]
MIWWRLKLRSKKTTKSTELPGKKNDETANILSVPPAPPVYTPSVGPLYAHTFTSVEGVPKTDSSKNSYKTAPESPPNSRPGAPHSTGRGVTFVSSVPPSPRGMGAASRRDAIDQTNGIVTWDHSRHRIVHSRTHNPRGTHALPTSLRDAPLLSDNTRPEPVAAESHATPKLGFSPVSSALPFNGRDRSPLQCGPADILTFGPSPLSAMPMPPLASHNGGRIPVFPLTHFPMPLHTDHQGAQVGSGVGQHPLASNGGTARRGRVLQRRNKRSPPGNRTFSPKTNHYAPTSVEGTRAHDCLKRGITLRVIDDAHDAFCTNDRRVDYSHELLTPYFHIGDIADIDDFELYSAIRRVSYWPLSWWFKMTRLLKQWLLPVIMRSPVIAFSILAAAAVSASTTAPSSSPDLSARSLDPSQIIDKAVKSVNSAGAKRRGVLAGLGFVDAGERDARNNAPHVRRATDAHRHKGRSSNAYDSHALHRGAERTSPPPRPDHRTEGADGCDGDNYSEGRISSTDGGVSCSSGAQGAAANQVGQHVGGESVASPDAGAASGTDITGNDLDDLMGIDGTSGGTGASPDAVGADGDDETIAPSNDYGNAYPAYPGTHTHRPLPRAFPSTSPEDARKELYEVVNNTMVGGNNPSLVRRAATPVNIPALEEDRSPNGVINPGFDGAPGESIQGASIPGLGTVNNPGGSAQPGAVGSSAGGRVIENGLTKDSKAHVPGVGDLSRSGTAMGGQGFRP